MKKNIYNKTDLDTEKAFKNMIYHRDWFAHYLRWTHILKVIKSTSTVLDWGCGRGSLFKVLYRNRMTPKYYLGIDIREQIIKKNIEEFKTANFNVEFKAADLVETTEILSDKKFDYIISFEVAEHIGKHKIFKFLENMIKYADKHTQIFISTPCYDPKVGAANNHIIDGEVGEFSYNEFKLILEQYFIIEENYGTFASIKDYKQHLNEHEKYMFDKLSAYYSSEIISILFAPLFPKYSRNCIWKLRLK